MPIVTKNKYSDELHPWEQYIPGEATHLLIGTFPTEKRNRKYDFFYCSSTNRFWEIICVICGISLKKLEEGDSIKNRQNLLKKLNLGLTDMGKRVYRQQQSSNDHSLFPTEFMDIIRILNENPTIETLIVSGNTDGNSSLSWFATFCSLNNIPVDGKKLMKVKSLSIHIASRKLKIVHAYSTSRLSRIKTETIIDCYRSIIL